MLNISLTGMLWTVVNLLVLYILLKKFLWAPVTAMIESRQKEIEDGLAGAAAKDQASQAKLEEYDLRLAQAGQEAARLVAQARDRGQREYEAILAKARDDAGRVTDEARQRVRQEREEMLRGARGEVASLALLCAAKVAGKELDGNADRALVEDFLARTGDGT